MRARPFTDRPDPSDARLLSASELPKCKKSRTDNEKIEPHRAVPKTARLEPTLVRLRKLRELPI
jgi:hypothetical protein